MFVPSHVASGYLLGKGIKGWLPKSWHYSKFVWMVITGAVIPDVDGIFSDTVAGHHSILHTPIFWMGVFLALWTVERLLKTIPLKATAFGLLIGAQLHLFTDWFTARTVGIQWLYPFSEKDYFLYPIKPEQGQVTVWEMVKDPYFSFYLENGFLFWTELIVLVLGAILYFSAKQDKLLKYENSVTTGV